MLGCQCRPESSNSNAWTASIAFPPKEFRWPPCTCWRLGWCKMLQVPVSVQHCGCCPVVVDWHLMLCHTQYIPNLALNEQSSGDKRTKWPPWTKRPITHQHRATASKVPSQLTDKDSQPPVYQVVLGQRVYILPGALWATLGHLPPIPQHPRTPGHKAFRSQLTAWAGWAKVRRCKWSTVQPRSARANPLWQPRALGFWGLYLPTKIPHLSGTPDAHGSGLQLMLPPGTSR